MFKKTIALVLTLTFFCSTALAMESRSKGAGENIEGAKTRERIQISQEEYDQKLKGANTRMLVGTIIGGVGVATIVGGAMYMKYTEDIGAKLPGACMLGFGTVAAATGLGVVIAGLVKRGSIKDKYYTLAPLIDTQKDSYGMALSMNF